MSSKIPRLDLEQFAPGLAKALAPRIERLGYLGEFFRVAAHQPEALLKFIEFTETAKSALDDRLVETIALTSSSVLGNKYERNQHERLCLKLGFEREWIAEVEKLSPKTAQISDAEAAVQNYVLEAIQNNGHAADALDAVISNIGPKDAIAVMLIMGRYVVHGLFVNSLNLAPPVPSIFEDARAI